VEVLQIVDASTAFYLRFSFVPLVFKEGIWYFKDQLRGKYSKLILNINNVIKDILKFFLKKMIK